MDTRPVATTKKRTMRSSGLTMLGVTSTIFLVAIVFAVYFVKSGETKDVSVTEVESGFDDMKAWDGFRSTERFVDWVREPGPLHVGVQAGHWLVAEVPDELQNLKNNIGARGGGHEEWEVNLSIAKETKLLLEREGVIVDILPATIPPGYLADAFIAFHADGNPDSSVSGFKIAAPLRTLAPNAERLRALVERHYAEASGLQKDPSITTSMKGYYAFNWMKYQHALHPKTPGIILETGFLTSSVDRAVIVRNPDLAARAVVEAIMLFLHETVPNQETIQGEG